MIAILTDRGSRESQGAQADGDALWIPEAELESVSGFRLEPRGACRGDVCVPIPTDRESEFVRGSQATRSLNLAALARHRGQPVLRTQTGDVWSIGESSDDRRAALASLEAPDFELPDPDGRPHRLSDHRGKKVLIVSWASW